MFTIVDGLARLLAPILSVTMDELWRMLPGEREASVHMALFPRDLEQWKDAALLERWAQLAAVRDQVNLALEEKRQEKVIKANLSARVGIDAVGRRRRRCSTTIATSCRRCSASRRSSVERRKPRRRRAGSRCAVERADGIKCERCWRFVPDGQRASRTARACARAASRRWPNRRCSLQ